MKLNKKALHMTGNWHLAFSVAKYEMKINLTIEIHYNKIVVIAET